MTRVMHRLVRSPRLLRGLLAAVALAGAGCADAGSFQPYEQFRASPVVKVGGQEVSVEVAASMEQRQRGLMFRESLPDMHGMLFVYPEPRILRFWMKDTPLPLDIAFIAEDGTIVNIEAMEPFVEAPGAVSLSPVPYALEMNQGWFARNGVKTGDKVELPDLSRVSIDS